MGGHGIERRSRSAWLGIGSVGRITRPVVVQTGDEFVIAVVDLEAMFHTGGGQCGRNQLRVSHEEVRGVGVGVDCRCRDVPAEVLKDKMRAIADANRKPSLAYAQTRSLEQANQGLFAWPWPTLPEQHRGCVAHRFK